jgi:tetratricopeptide (TPR) repeat protein
LAKQPRNGWVLAQLGTCLSAVERNAEAEKMLREAVRVSPKDWRPWADLGGFLPKHALLQIGITDLSDITLNGPEAAIDQLEPLLKRTGPAHAIAVLQKASAEAHADFDRAVSLSPNSPEPYTERGKFVYSDTLLTQNIIKLLKEETPDTTNVFPTAMVRDMSRAADLAPYDPERQATAAISEIALVANTVGDALKAGEPGAIDRMPEPSRDRIKREIQRLRKIVGEKDRRNAQIAAVSLINIELMGGETAQAEQFAKLALTREPTSRRAWDALCEVYRSAEKYQDLAKALEDRIKHEDTPYNCLALAKTYDQMADTTRASKLVLAGVQRFPNDFLLNLAAVDVLLRQTDAGALQQAEKHMEHAQALFARLSDDDRKSQSANMNLTRGVYLALTGKITYAREALQKVLEEDEYDPEAKTLVAILDASSK